MSWRFPPHRIMDKHAAGVQDVNENLWEFADAINGNLNEQNWRGDIPTFAATQFSTVTSDAASRIYSTSVEADGSDPGASPTGTVELSMQSTWEPVGLRVSLTSPGGALWIVASGLGSSSNAYDFEGYAVLPSYPQYDTTVQVGVQINGQIQHESVIGSSDLEQTDHRRPRAGAGTITGAVRTNIGYNRSLFPWATECLLVVPPGNHTIDVMARVVKTSTAGKPKLFARELIVLEFVG